MAQLRAVIGEAALAVSRGQTLVGGVLMRNLLKFVPLTLLAGCAQGCAIGKALYLAVVHNSGAPPRAERDRIDVREAAMLANLGRARVLVLPVTILGREQRFDSAAAVRFADSLKALGVQAKASGTAVPLPYEPQPNELFTFWTRFKALGDWVRAHPASDADYVLAIDVLGAPERGSVGAVHAMAVTARGELAYRALWNSHQDLYKEIQPRTLDDANKMVITDLARRSAK